MCPERQWHRWRKGGLGNSPCPARTGCVGSCAGKQGQLTHQSGCPVHTWGRGALAWEEMGDGGESDGDTCGVDTSHGICPPHHGPCHTSEPLISTASRDGNSFWALDSPKACHLFTLKDPQPLAQHWPPAGAMSQPLGWTVQGTRMHGAGHVAEAGQLPALEELTV